MAHSLVFKHIPSDDINLMPFTVFKNWAIDQNYLSGSTFQYGTKIRRAVLDEDWKIYDYPHGFMTALPNLDGSDQKTLWYNINGMYYKEQKNEFDIEYSDYMIRNLHATASYVQLPQQIFGEGIKLGSVRITNGITILQDDTFGNLYDTSLNTGSMAPVDNLISYWGFNDKFKYQSHESFVSGSIRDTNKRNNLQFRNLRFLPGIQTTGAQTKPTGLKARFENNGYAWIDQANDYNFKFDDDFSISLWTELPESQSNVTYNTNWLISKQGQTLRKSRNTNTYLITDVLTNYTTGKYPYSIEFYNQNTSFNGLVRVSRNDINKTPTITSTTRINDGNQHHIVFNKTGSLLELWIDGVREGYTNDTTYENTHNDAILTIGGNGINNNTGISGSLDEIRFYNTGLSNTQIRSLSNMDYVTGSAYNTAIVGNVFYPAGTMVISDPRPKYQNILLGNNFDYSSSSDDNFTINFRSTLTLYENEVVCRVEAGEFNFTSNPTIRTYNDMDSPAVKDFATSSLWYPYISTIGLYDEYGRLLAVGKTANPIPIRDDVDTTFIIRYDET
jgi:hypothetical protein